MAALGVGGPVYVTPAWERERGKPSEGATVASNAAAVQKITLKYKQNA